MGHPADSEHQLHSPLDRAAAGAVQALRASFDTVNGGFSQPPKTPRPDALAFLLGQYSSHGDREALHMACHTLRRLALSGINDQVGGGFFVRAHDAWWMTPIFEKRTGDNARLAMLYLDAWHATGDGFFARIARETLDWALREARTADGAFLAAIGRGEQEAARYYTWTPDEAERHLDAEQYALVHPRFGLDDSPNLGRRWHLHVYASLSELAKTLHRPRSELEETLRGARETLWAARRRRPAPPRDERVPALENALMLRALARAGRLLEAPELLDAAERTLGFINDNLWDGARLRASLDETAPVNEPAALAALLAGVLELQQGRWRSGQLALAQTLASALEPRGAPAPEAAESVTALHELGLLLGEPSLMASAQALAERALQGTPEKLGSHELDWLAAAEILARRPRLAVLQGPSAQVEDWRRQAERYFNPGRRVYVFAEDTALPPALVEAHSAPEGVTRAWVCEENRCQGPLETLDALLQALRTGPG